MKRIAASILAMLLLAVPLSVRPLGLGEIQLNSYLNAPLDAKIPLHSLQEGDLEGMRVALGTIEQFRRAGIERPFSLSKLRFRISEDNGKSFIHVTSREVITEPFLNFLVEVDWPSGRALREYTVLLDPPVYGAAISSRAKAAVATVAAPPSRTAVATGRAERRPIAALEGTYGPVRANDTLWALADRFRGDSRVSIQQMMLAVLRLNPEAFLRGNVNLLRRGAVLQIPTQADVQELTRAQAIAQVQLQHAAWQEYRGRGTVAQVPKEPAAQAPTQASTKPSSGSTPSTGDTPSTEPASQATSSQPTGRSAPAQPVTAPAAARSELKLVSGGTASGGVGSSTGESAQISALNEELNRARELADANQRESEELAGRLEEAEAIIKELERLVNAQDSELAALQQKLAGAGAVPGSASAGAAGTTAAGSGTEPAASATSPSQPKMPVVPLPKTSTQPAGFLDQVRQQLDFLPVDPLLAIGGIIVIVVLAVVGLVFSRRRKEDAPEPQAAVGAAALDLGEDDAETTRMAAADSDATELGTTLEAPSPPSAPEVVRAGPEEDPLAEVNVYLAYERYEQAESLVNKAIEEHPDRHDYKLKLLEIHHAAKNLVAFEAAAMALQAAVGADSEEMNTTRQWWDSLGAGRELFAAAGGAELPTQIGGTAPTADIRDLTGADRFAPGETTAQLSGGGIDLNNGVDFDLGLGRDGDEPATMVGEGTNVDFDLALSDGSPAAAADSGVDFDLGIGEPEGADSDVLPTSLDFDLDALDLGEEDAGDGSLDFVLDDPDDVLSSETAELRSDTDLDFMLDDAGGDGQGQASDAGEAPPREVGTDTDLDFDLADFTDTDAKLDAGTEFGSGPDRVALTGESDGDDGVLDFDLSEFEATTTEAPVRAADSADMGSETDLDLDLELDSLAETAEIPSGEDAGDTNAPSLEFDLEIPSSPAEHGEDSGLDLDLGALETGSDPAGELGTVELDAPIVEADSADGGNEVLGIAEEGGELDFALGSDEDPTALPGDDAPLLARAVEGEDDTRFTAVDFDLSDEDETALPSDEAGRDETLSIDEDFAGLFAEAEDVSTDDGVRRASGEADELSELDLELGAEDATDLPLVGAAETIPGEDPELDLDALLTTDDDSDSEFEGVFDDLPAGGSDDDEITDLNLDEPEVVAADGAELLDFDLGELDDDSTAGSAADGLDFDLTDFDAAEPAEDVMEPVEGSDDGGEPQTLALEGGATGEVDEIQTKLDLAQAYIDMGDADGAKGILGEVVAEGTDDQRGQAEALLNKLD